MSDRTHRHELWREEFSIKNADEQYVTRRQFGKFLMLTSLGMCAGNLWIFARSRTEKAESYPEALIARRDEVLVGGVKLFSYPTEHDPCILIRPEEETFVAYSQKCTHLSCAVFYDHEAGKIECPCHDGFFAVLTGEVLQGPPPRPLPKIVLAERGEELFAVGVSLREEG